MCFLVVLRKLFANHGLPPCCMLAFVFYKILKSIDHRIKIVIIKCTNVMIGVLAPFYSLTRRDSCTVHIVRFSLEIHDLDSKKLTRRDEISDNFSGLIRFKRVRGKVGSGYPIVLFCFESVAFFRNLHYMFAYISSCKLSIHFRS